MKMMDEIVVDGKKEMLNETCTTYAGKALGLATWKKSKHSELVEGIGGRTRLEREYGTQVE